MTGVSGAGISETDADARYKQLAASQAVTGAALLDNTFIRLFHVPTNDHEFSGITTTETAGETVDRGEIIYLKSDAKGWLADANAAASMPAVGLATADVAAEATGESLLMGIMRDDSWSWTVGAKLYASAASAGAITETPPAGAGDQIQIVGIAISAAVIYWNPSLVLVEVA